MSGPVEWPVLIFIVGIIITTCGLAGTCVWFLAGISKDVRHTKNAVKQHAVIFEDMHEDVIRMEAEVKRIGDIVNHRTAPTTKRR